MRVQRSRNSTTITIKPWSIYIYSYNSCNLLAKDLLVAMEDLGLGGTFLEFFSERNKKRPSRFSLLTSLSGDEDLLMEMLMWLDNKFFKCLLTPPLLLNNYNLQVEGNREKEMKRNPCLNLGMTLADCANSLHCLSTILPLYSAHVG